MGPLRVSLRASDPITRAGIAAKLQDRPGVAVIGGTPQDEVDVRVLAADRLSPHVLSTLRTWSKSSTAPVVLITGDVDEHNLTTVVECGVVAVLPRAPATAERLVGVLRAVVSGCGFMAPEMLGKLLRHIYHLQRNVLASLGLNALGLSLREVAVLRLMANGFDTEEIARELNYSKRTIKNTIYTLTTRLGLRNRAHAVAFAIRAGVI